MRIYNGRNVSNKRHLLCGGVKVCTCYYLNDIVVLYRITYKVIVM